METRAVVVAVEVGNPVVELGERVRAVDHDVHALRVRHRAHFLDRQNLSGDVDHMADHQQARARSDRIRVELDDLVI